MSVKTLTSAILRKMSVINKRRQRFLVHLVGLFLSMRCRKNFLMMERHGSYSEQTYRQHFSRPHDFKTFNRELIRECCGKELVWVFDPSYISKSGKATPGTGYFWSGCAGKMKWGLELSAVAMLDVGNRTAMHYHAERSAPLKGEEILYEGVVHVRALKRWCKAVLVHNLDEQRKVKSVLIYFSTHVDMPGHKVAEYYHNRYQIEFNFRDAKGHLGLEDCQSRQGEALDFHFNHVLTTLNIAKAEHWLSIPKDKRGPFSMAAIKTRYINELILDQLILIYGKSPSVEKNNPQIRKLYDLGRIAA